jgi:hypothetical protein
LLIRRKRKDRYHGLFSSEALDSIVREVPLGRWLKRGPYWPTPKPTPACCCGCWQNYIKYSVNIDLAR